MSVHPRYTSVMNPNVNMAAMNPMGGPVGGAPMPMMNNGVNPQAQAQQQAVRQQMNEGQRGVLNTYIYEYFLRYGMYDCARSLINSDQQVNVHKEGTNRRRDENGNLVNGIGDDPMDTDSKDDIDSKLPEDLPPPKLPMPASDTSFLYEWFCLFWDIYNAQRAKGGNGNVNQYVAHTQVCYPRTPSLSSSSHSPFVASSCPYRQPAGLLHTNAKWRQYPPSMMRR